MCPPRKRELPYVFLLEKHVNLGSGGGAAPLGLNGSDPFDKRSYHTTKKPETVAHSCAQRNKSALLTSLKVYMASSFSLG